MSGTTLIWNAKDADAIAKQQERSDQPHLVAPVQEIGEQWRDRAKLLAITTICVLQLVLLMEESRTHTSTVFLGSVYQRIPHAQLIWSLFPRVEGWEGRLYLGGSSLPLLLFCNCMVLRMYMGKFH